MWQDGVIKLHDAAVLERRSIIRVLNCEGVTTNEIQRRMELLRGVIKKRYLKWGHKPGADWHNRKRISTGWPWYIPRMRRKSCLFCLSALFTVVICCYVCQSVSCSCAKTDVRWPETGPCFGCWWPDECIENIKKTIMAGDESGVYGYNPETKAQSSQ